MSVLLLRGGSSSSSSSSESRLLKTPDFSLCAGDAVLSGVFNRCRLLYVFTGRAEDIFMSVRKARERGVAAVAVANRT